MKTLTKIVFAASAMLFIASAANAEWVRGYVRKTGTFVAPYYRTPANGIPYDNLSYRGYPSQQPKYVSPLLMPSLGTDTFEPELLGVKSSYLSSRQISGSSVRQDGITFHDISTSDGKDISGTSTAIGDITFHDLTSWDGKDISGSSIAIDDITFHDFITSDGEDMSGTSMAIGDIIFHDFSTSEGEDISGTSIAIGDINFHDFTTSDEDTISGETITIGNTSFTTIDE